MTRCSQRERVVTQIIHSEKQLTHSFASIEQFHSRSQQPRKFVVTKESCYLRRRLNSLRTGLENHHGRRFAVLRHQYGGRDNMRKHSMNKILIIHLNSRKLLLFVTKKWIKLLLFSVKNVHSVFCGSFTFLFPSEMASFISREHRTICWRSRHFFALFKTPARYWLTLEHAIVTELANKIAEDWGFFRKRVSTDLYWAATRQSRLIVAVGSWWCHTRSGHSIHHGCTSHHTG